ncbi:hypothetical protein ACFQ1E_13400 [Sphingomonas canadensis]|uniref:SnoaL-like domain-containing protein n=1 Tax=Sphingomonas canadensis TaxID=1219257 RepID=A0ABW3H8K8_9SPHN|nr:hypothetical protein [Sphingomonas canadensis]MCW3837006.1 hypothetical protein [Sphingomonas canadensis]
MVTVKRSSLRLVSIALGLVFTAAVYCTMHYGFPWDWKAPGTGKLPREIVAGFMAQAYDRGRGAQAVRDYFVPGAADDAPGAQDRRDGVPIPHEIRSVVAQGTTVVVFHRIAAARGEAAADVIDLFVTVNGRIIRRERYPTRFVSR